MGNLAEGSAKSSQIKEVFSVSCPSLFLSACLSGGHLMSPLSPSSGRRPPAKTPLLPRSMEATVWPSRLQSPA